MLQKTTDFDWDEANIAHIAKHDVLPEEAEDIFFDLRNVLDDDVKHSTKNEKRFLIIGKTSQERILYQIFTIRENKIRVISSRTINKKEVKLYEEKINRS